VAPIINVALLPFADKGAVAERAPKEAPESEVVLPAGASVSTGQAGLDLLEERERDEGLVIAWKELTGASSAEEAGVVRVVQHSGQTASGYLAALPESKPATIEFLDQGVQ
jgi:hypothetical protein